MFFKALSADIIVSNTEIISAFEQLDHAPPKSTEDVVCDILVTLHFIT